MSKIGAVAELTREFRPQNPEEREVWEQAVQGHVTDINAFEDGLLHVVFEGYGENGTDLGVWVHERFLYFPYEN